ncbi:MAG: hypothetical protein RL572_1413 [Pseudomonadota bacterium]|jgi:putative ubiquitin-RnfH superfamily antitoxin RatB of RatAB toxin-antitoxin module
MIPVEVVYALPQRQCLLQFEVAPGSTALQAVQQSGILAQFSEIDLATASLGVFSRLLDGHTLPLPAQYQVQAHDRIEIYRPLLVDPKQARLRRAAKKRHTAKGGQ